MKKVEFMVEDLKTLETQPVIVKDVQMRRFKGRQHNLWNSSRTRDRQREHLKPRDCFKLTELVVSSNAEVGDRTCRRVSFGVCTKGKLRKSSTSGVQEWLGLERHVCKVKWSPVGAMTEQSSERLIMLG
ncbi:hypothetical protein CDL15_Pgr006673 [Punica granatum]|nr:hypothetical protein CDL15_Pgr006673 [Punica granatum]